MCTSMKRIVLVNVLCFWLWCVTHCWAEYEFSMPDVDCDFDTDLCGWEKWTKSYSPSWERKQGVAARYGDTGPSRDHTSGRGWYLLFATSNYQGRRTAYLSSPSLSTIQDACLSFWYLMHGYDVGHLKVYRSETRSKKREELFSKVGHQGKRWYHAVANVTPGIFKLEFEATYNGWNGLGDIAIDDISLSHDGGCSYDDAELMKDQPRFDCDFEVDFCSWHPVKDEISVWIRKTIEADRMDRNALAPFTNGTSFIRTRTRSYTTRYAVITLRGPTISVGEKRACMSFWYKKFLNQDKFTVVKHNYGSGKYNSGGEELFLTKKKNVFMWEQAQVTLPKGENYYIVFRASDLTTYVSATGTLAIDDVTISYGGPCPEDNEESKINCDFDTNFCLWYMMSPKNADDWQRGTGSTPSLHTGPDHDHTKGDGYYAYLDASTVEKATLFSPFIDAPSERSCLSFWYYMHGKDVANLSLNVYQISFHENSLQFLYPNKTLWARSGEQGDTWLKQYVSIPSGTDILVGFEAVRGYFPRGDIAIDDIKFEGLCEKDVTITTTSTTTTAAPTNMTTIDDETITEKPKLLTPHVSVIGKVDPAFENTTVELICDEERDGTHYKWYSEQIVGPDNETILSEVNDQRKLIFNEIQLSQAGAYWCQLSELHHQTSDISNKVLVDVVPDPRPVPNITTKGLMYAEPAIVNHVLQLTCGYRVEGASYHWKTTSLAFLNSQLPTNQTLTLHARPEHSGFYSCYVTKDGYSTASSAKFDLRVTSGRRCTSDDSCDGRAYIPHCNDMRCDCSSDAVLQDNTCEMRPKQPKIYTSPAFLEFAYGETFYLVCEAQMPVPSNAVYSFRRDDQPLSQANVLQASNILKITDADEENGGNYECFVTHRNIDSFRSHSISVEIKEFADLSCDFTKDLCEWSAQIGPGYVNVNLATSTTGSVDRKAEEFSPSESFITVSKEKETARAMLKSPTINRSSLDSCLSLWYRMSGSDVFSLTVWTFTFSADWQENKGERLWTAVGDHGDKWIRHNVTVSAGEEFYVAIEALGIVDIDDIVFTYRGSC